LARITFPPSRQLLAAQAGSAYGIEIAEALEKAHSNGIVHRGLKLGNVVLAKSGAKLLDFGLAKPAHNVASMASGSMATMSKPLTVEGTIVGTCQFMAPEQLSGRGYTR
jgi:serine/threonine protein kinase